MSEIKEKFNPYEEFKFFFDGDGMFSSCIVPKLIAVCPCCDAGLVIEATGWSKENGFYLPNEISVECNRDIECYEENENSMQWRMPYVYWLPVEDKCKKWLYSMLKIYYKIKPVPPQWIEKNYEIKFHDQAINS